MQIDELKQKLPLPQLMEQLGYGEFAKRSVCSPFREDKNPSWGIYEDAKGWHFKDFATGEGGDELDFLAIHNKCDAKQALKLSQFLYTTQSLKDFLKEKVENQQLTKS